MWSIGVADENARFVALVALVKRSEAEIREDLFFFFTVSNLYLIGDSDT